MSPQYKTKKHFFQHKQRGNSPLSLDKKKLKLRYFGNKTKLKSTPKAVDDPQDIISAKYKLKDAKSMTEIERISNKLYLAQNERLKHLNIFCDTLSTVNITNAKDTFSIYMNNMGRITQSVEVKYQKHLMNMKNDLLDGLNGFNNNGVIAKCNELKNKLKLRRNRNNDKMKDEFVSSIQMMETQKYVLLNAFKRYMMSYGDYAYQVKMTLNGDKQIMQYRPPNINNRLDLDSDTEDINDNNQTMSSFNIWNKTAVLLKSGWINKKGKRQKTFSRRWFQLFSNKKLIYLTDEGSNGVLKGHIDLKRVIDINKKSSNLLLISTEYRHWTLQLDNTQQRNTWYEIMNGVTKTETAMILQCSNDDIMNQTEYMEQYIDDDMTVSYSEEYSEFTEELPQNRLLSPSISISSTSIDIPDLHERLPPMELMLSVDEEMKEESTSQTSREDTVEVERFLSLYDIVELVTSPKERGTQHQTVLLNTYTLYTTREELLEVIFQRLSNISDSLEHKQGQIKVISLLRTWLKIENDFKDDEENIERLSPFALYFCKQLMINTQNNELLQKLSRPIIVQISMPPQDDIEEKNRYILNEAPSTKKIPKVKSAKELSLNMLHPSEVARQICLSEYEIFKNIKPEEFLKQKSSKEKEMELKIYDEEHKLSEAVLLNQLKELKRLQSEHKEKASTQPNIDKMRDWFNRLSVWAQSEVLSQMDLNQRCKVLSNLLIICHKLEKYNNISSLCAIRAGLCSAPIHRLRKTWDNISKKSKETMAALDQLFKLGNGQKNLRDRISIISQPAIPHLGIFLGDIVFIHDGNDTFSDDNDEKKINWGKMKLLADRIAWISMFQQSPFIYKPVPIIKQYLESKMKIIPEDFLYKLSRSVEPPEKKKPI